MSKGSKNQTTTTRVEVPSFLQPFLSGSATTAGNALSSLRGKLTGAGADQLVAPFNPLQTQAMQLAVDRAMGSGGFFPTAQQSLLKTAQGRSVPSFGLEQFGGDLSGFLPQAALSTLTSGATSSAVPTQATNAAGEIISGQLIPQASTDALTRTASGDFLFGGQGFDQAVEAALRAARPGIISTFGRGGVGGATGGLAQAAIGRAAVDAFANQFAQERQNQLSAASQLANLGLAGGQQRLSAAGLLGELGLAGQAQQLGAAQSLAGLGDAERARALQASGLLGGFSDAERNRQMQAALNLPGIATADADLLSRIGGAQQQMSQRQLTAPIDAQQMLLQAALGGLGNPASFFGQTQSTPTQSSGLLGALGLAGTGLGIANALAPSGATGLAALGGPVGLGLSLGIPLLAGLLG